MPGHSLGSVCFYSEQANALFCGDSHLNWGNYVSEEQCETAIEALSKLPEVTRVCPGHGDEIMTLQAFISDARTIFAEKPWEKKSLDA